MGTSIISRFRPKLHFHLKESQIERNKITRSLRGKMVVNARHLSAFLLLKLALSLVLLTLFCPQTSADNSKDHCLSKKTEKGRICQAWSSQPTFSKERVGAENWEDNRCLGVGHHEPWCYYDFPKWERCGEENCDIDECASDPCQNGATCVEKRNNGYLCQCAPGYTDIHCQTERRARPCDNWPCGDGFSCLDDDWLPEGQSFRCYCHTDNGGVQETINEACYTDSKEDCFSRKTEKGRICQAWSSQSEFSKERVGAENWEDNRCLRLGHTEPWCFYDYPIGERCGEENCGSNNRK